MNLSLNLQLFISTVLMTPVLYVSAQHFLPDTFTLSQAGMTVTKMDCFWCTTIGLWAGYVIGYTTNYYTSGSFSPV